MSLKPIPFGLARYGHVLSTRELGAVIVRELQRDAADATGLLVGFWDVEVVTPAVLDEIVMGLRGWLAGVPVGERMLAVAGYNDDVKESLLMVLERRKMALAALEDDQIKLLGGNRQLAATVKEAQNLHSFDAPELAERLELKMPNLHQRLQALMEAGAVTREPDPTATRGRKHRYTAVNSGDLASLTPA